MLLVNVVRINRRTEDRKWLIRITKKKMTWVSGDLCVITNHANVVNMTRNVIMHKQLLLFWHWVKYVQRWDIGLKLDYQLFRVHSDDCAKKIFLSFRYFPGNVPFYIKWKRMIEICQFLFCKSRKTILETYVPNGETRVHLDLFFNV
jgi:hypothetical protein